jgi:hypothetical protein
MIHAKDSAGVTSPAHDPDVPIDRALEIGGVPYIMAAVAVELLTVGGLKGTQAAHKLRQLARTGKVRTVRLAPKLTAYQEADVIKARRELLDGTR